MGLELIIFIVAILFGIFLYWRESNGNGLYRALNKIVNSKELQMSADDPKGFVYKQSILPRIIFVVTLVLIAALIVEFLTPLAVFSSYNGISAFSSFAVGTLIGTYLASFVIKSTEVIEEKSDSISDMVGDAVEKGKDFIEDLKSKDTKIEEEVVEEVNESKENIEVDQKSARERLKDKGLM
ncbi:hypothetical protein [uncultured Winogradskyella sp.]|uniref:hypothetical protein n=1 Tax=uncultured Winogradskyella sp. TaxID=395353 RepID=UPI002607EC82|nr:hypothetical protein [uncultured Winogradskyella sp.]